MHITLSLSQNLHQLLNSLFINNQFLPNLNILCMKRCNLRNKKNPFLDKQYDEFNVGHRASHRSMLISI